MEKLYMLRVIFDNVALASDQIIIYIGYVTNMDN